MIKDFLVDSENDLLVENGDLKIGSSDIQNAHHLIRASKGDYKEFPQKGCDIDSYLASVGLEQDIRRNIQIQLEDEGYKVDDIKITKDPFDIQVLAEYEGN